VTTAPELIVRTARARPGEVTVICLAPLTNLAVALDLEPELPRLLERVVVMGGAFLVPGNITPYAEFNAWVDPEAAAIVARSTLNLLFIGLDVTHQAELTQEMWRLLASSGRPEGELVAALGRSTFEERGRSVLYLHDPLAVAVAAMPDLVSTDTSVVAVDTGVGETAGQTRLVRGPGAAHAVALGLDRERFSSLFQVALGLG
jgi:inosine-uridine nucleoside N-ribohydrolase